MSRYPAFQLNCADLSGQLLPVHSVALNTNGPTREQNVPDGGSQCQHDPS